MGRSRSTQPFATLEPRVRHVAAATIRKKWRKLSPTAQDRVKQLLLSIKSQSRASKKPTGRKALDPTVVEVEMAVDEITERLLKRLPRMPFPPSSSSTDETHFDFEGTLDRISALEAQLSCATQAMALLRAQIKREERLLKRDRMELNELRDGARRSERMRRDREHRLHPLARDLDMDAVGGHEDGEKPGFVKPGAVSLNDLEGDESLDPLVKQLRSHLESMRTNTAGMKPVMEAMDEAQEALDRFAYCGLSRKQYTLVYGLDQT